MSHPTVATDRALEKEGMEAAVLCISIADWGVSWSRVDIFTHPPLRHYRSIDIKAFICPRLSLQSFWDYHFDFLKNTHTHIYFPLYDILLNVLCATWDTRLSSELPLIFKMQPISVLSTTNYFLLPPLAWGLFPPRSGSMGAGGPHRVQGNCSGQPMAIHWCLHHPGHGRHALPSGLLGLLWSHPWKQVSAPLCESAGTSKCSSVTDLVCVFIFFSVSFWTAMLETESQRNSKMPFSLPSCLEPHA